MLTITFSVFCLVLFPFALVAEDDLLSTIVQGYALRKTVHVQDPVADRYSRPGVLHVQLEGVVVLSVVDADRTSDRDLISIPGTDADHVWIIEPHPDRLSFLYRDRLIDVGG